MLQHGSGSSEPKLPISVLQLNNVHRAIVCNVPLMQQVEGLTLREMLLSEEGLLVNRVLRFFAFTVFWATPTAAAEIDSIVLDLTADGYLRLQDGTVIVPWGLNIPKTASLEELLVGKWIRCRTIKTMETFVLADCLIAPSERQPDTANEYLDMFTWLPRMMDVTTTCDPFELYANHSIWVRGIGQLEFGCRSGTPLRGVARS